LPQHGLHSLCCGSFLLLIDMQILTDSQAERLCGGLGPITIAPAVSINNGIINAIQLNTGTNVAASLGGNATTSLLQGTGLGLISLVG
jgi:hypothetical protein